MKNIKILASFIGLSTLFIGCDREDIFDNKNEQGEGFISSTSLNLTIIPEALSTRSDDTPLEKDFTVEIINKKTNVSEIKCNYEALPEVLSLPVGTYVVKAYYGDGEVTAAFDSPYYYGEVDNVVIQANKITDVDPLECKPSNIRVSIIFDDTIRKKMGKDSKVIVKVGKSGELEFTANTTEDGYFKYDEGSTTLAAQFIGTVDGAEYKEIKELSKIQPGYYYQITFKLNSMKPSDGNGDENDPSDPGNSDDDPNDNPNQDPGTIDPPSEDDPSKDDPSGDDPSTDNPGGTDNPGSGDSGNDNNKNTGTLRIDASVIYILNNKGAEENLFTNADEEYLVDGSNWDYSGDDPFNNGDVKPDPGVPDVDPDDPNNPGSGEEIEDPTPDVPELTKPFVTGSPGVNVNGITNITNWNKNNPLEIVIHTSSKMTQFVCYIESEELVGLIGSMGLTDRLDLLNDNYEKQEGESESQAWKTLRLLGFPVGKDITEPKEMDENGNYIIKFSLSNEVEGNTFVELLRALGSGTHSFIFHLKNEYYINNPYDEEVVAGLTVKVD